MPDASWGYTAEQGLEAVLGGVDIDKIRRGEGAMSREEMRRYIESAPDEKNVSYSDEARRFAKALLKEADNDPAFISMHTKLVADKIAKAGDFDLTGFMFGWAYNAVRYVLGEHPIENPAIVTIGG